MTKIEKRSEILFIYDIENANPNGDPNDENKPRIDEETGKNIVTDVRLKRTVRDHLFENGNEIFVREVIYDNDGHIQDAKLRASDYLKKEKTELEKMTLEEQKKNISENILGECIDVRLFGATIPLELSITKEKNGKKEVKKEKSSITFTGPVQFKMGKSLHAVKTHFIKGTGAFASGSDSTKKTFREEYVLPYSLISFAGIVNENAAEKTNLTDNDVAQLLKAMWNGTKGLASRSKYGQIPRLLLKINYSEKNFFIGEIDNLISLKTEKRDEQLRGPDDYLVDLTLLLEKIEKHKERISSVDYIVDDRVKFVKRNGEHFEHVNLSKLEYFKDISTEVL